MGVICSITKLSDATARPIREQPALYWQLEAPDDPEAIRRAIAIQVRRRQPLLSRIFGKAPPIDPPAPLLLGDSEGSGGKLDKAWDGLHFLFTSGRADAGFPADFLVRSGTALEVPLCDDRPRWHDASATQAIAKFIAGLERRPSMRASRQARCPPPGSIRRLNDLTSNSRGFTLTRTG